MGLNLYSNCRISIGTSLDLYNLTEPPMDHTSNGTKPLMDRISNGTKPLMDRISNGPSLSPLVSTFSRMLTLFGSPHGQGSAPPVVTLNSPGQGLTQAHTAQF